MTKPPDRSASADPAPPLDRGKKQRRLRKPRAALAPRRSIREDAINLPNLLTMLRVVMIPIVLWLVYDGRPVMNYWAAFVYAVAAATDALDGWLVVSYFCRFVGWVCILWLVVTKCSDLIGFDICLCQPDRCRIAGRPVCK